MNDKVQFVFVAVLLPSRAVYYYRQEGRCWTGDIARATLYPNRSSREPAAHLYRLKGEIEHKWVELAPVTPFKFPVH